MVSSEETLPPERAWRRVQRHFTESFSGELLKADSGRDTEPGEELRDQLDDLTKAIERLTDRVDDLAGQPDHDG